MVSSRARSNGYCQYGISSAPVSPCTIHTQAHTLTFRNKYGLTITLASWIYTDINLTHIHANKLKKVEIYGYPTMFTFINEYIYLICFSAPEFLKCITATI